MCQPAPQLEKGVQVLGTPEKLQHRSTGGNYLLELPDTARGMVAELLLQKCNADSRHDSEVHDVRCLHLWDAANGNQGVECRVLEQ